MADYKFKIGDLVTLTKYNDNQDLFDSDEYMWQLAWETPQKVFKIIDKRYSGRFVLEDIDNPYSQVEHYVWQSCDLVLKTSSNNDPNLAFTLRRQKR